MKRFPSLFLILIILWGCGGSKQLLDENQSFSKKDFPFGKRYEYVYRLVKPVVRDSLYFSDANIFVEFVIDESFVHLRLKNKKGEKILLSLNDAQIFVNMRSSKVKRFSYVNEFYYSPMGFEFSSIEVFPNDFVELHIAPSDNVIESGGDYEVVNLYPAVDFGDENKSKEIYNNIGEKIGLYLPVETEVEVYDYYFEFQIVDVKEAGSYYPRRRGVAQQIQVPKEIVIKGEGLSPSESFIASTLISFFVLISAYFIFAREKGKI